MPCLAATSRIRSTSKLDNRRVLTGPVCYCILRVGVCNHVWLQPEKTLPVQTNPRRTMLSQATHPPFRHRRVDLKAPRHLINSPTNSHPSALEQLAGTEWTRKRGTWRRQLSLEKLCSTPPRAVPLAPTTDAGGTNSNTADCPCSRKAARKIWAQH